MFQKIITALLILGLTGSVFCDGILKITQGSGTYLSPLKTELKVSIVNQVATTAARQSFVNTSAESVQVKYCFPLNSNASVTSVAWEMDSLRYTAVIEAKPQDTSVRNDSGPQDYTLSLYLGTSPFFFPLPRKIGPGKELTLELTYIELLEYHSGNVAYEYPYSTPSVFNSGTIEFLDISVNLSSQRKITGMNAVSWPNGTQSVHDYQAAYALQLANPSADRNFSLTYTLDANDLGLFMLSHQPDSGDGYFLMIAEPDPKTSQQKIIDKVFTYVIDMSGSMAGTRLTQAKDAAKYCVQNLNAGDKFNIIAFDTRILTFNSLPVQATAANISAALTYINGILDGGGTDINNALLTALAQYSTDTTSNVIIFLTDGEPTSGVTSTNDILSNIKAANTRKVKLFAFGIGTGMDNALLAQLSQQNNGMAGFLANDEVTQKISEFYAKIKDPVLQNISLGFSAGGVNPGDLLPLNIPDVFVGQQLIIAGRYKTSGPTTVSLVGSNVNGPITYTYNALFSDSANNPFVAKIWAKMRIEALFTLLYKSGETSVEGQEYKNEIIRLSLEYGIQTKYTSYTDNNGSGQPLSIEEKADGAQETVEDISLSASPNPFNPRVMLTLSLPPSFKGLICLEIYDAQGKLIKRLFRGTANLNRAAIEWNGRDDFGRSAAAGVYIVRATCAGKVVQSRIMLVK